MEGAIQGGGGGLMQGRGGKTLLNWVEVVKIVRTG